MMNKKILSQKVLGLGFACLILATVFYAHFHRQSIIKKSVLNLDSVYLNNIDQKQNYSSRIILIDSNTTEGAEIKVYFDKNRGYTKIIEASYGGETFRYGYEYYFDDVENFLVIERYERWDRPYSIEGRLKIKDETNKYYFTKLNMVQWSDSDNEIENPQSETFREKEQEILKQLDQFLNSINK